jgi:hypothetical protein
MRRIAFPRSEATNLVLSLAGRMLSAVALVLLISCSSSTSSPAVSNASSTAAATAAAGALPEPCSLITQAEVENVLGKGATMTPVANQRTGMHECRLKAATTGTIEVIVIVVHNADLWDATKKAMLPPNSDAKSVSGLGDDAFVGRAIGYNVRKGNKYVQVFGAVTNNDAANDKATRYLAERAASRLSRNFDRWLIFL